MGCLGHPPWRGGWVYFARSKESESHFWWWEGQTVAVLFSPTIPFYFLGTGKDGISCLDGVFWQVLANELLGEWHLTSSQKATRASAGTIQTVAAPSAPVQREDREAPANPEACTSRWFVGLSYWDLELSGKPPILPMHLHYLKRLSGASSVRKHKTLLRRKDSGT